MTFNFLLFQERKNTFVMAVCIVMLIFSFQKKKTSAPLGATEQNVPRSFVMHRGDVGKSVLQLETDLKRVMEPYTALNLKVCFSP